ncbi:hypothetical protein I4U23_002434 [Adineta vaga]|nr:hypothetical protein I4U23_002434 [Adineta vaga]
MSLDMIPSSQIDSNSDSSTNDSNHNITDVLLYAESKITRKQAVREIADVVLRANMKPRTVKHALQLLKSLLPPENTLPATVNELFGAMLSSENDWRLAQYLIKHKQRPSFLSASSISSSSNIWSENSNSATSLTAASSSSIPTIQPLNIPRESSPLFLPLSSNNGNSSSSNSSDSSSENSSESSTTSSSSSSSESDDDDDDNNNDEDDDEEDEEEDDDADERNILRVLQEAQQQRRVNASSSSSSPPLQPITESAEIDNNLNHVTTNNLNESSDQRSQIVSSSFNRFPFLGSFKRQRSETSSDESDSEPDLFFRTRLSDNHDENDDNEDDDDDDDDDDSDSDDETTFYSISNNNNTNNIKSRCFEMNGCDLLDGGKRRRHL